MMLQNQLADQVSSLNPAVGPGRRWARSARVGGPHRKRSEWPFSTAAPDRRSLPVAAPVAPTPGFEQFVPVADPLGRERVVDDVGLGLVLVVPHRLVGLG